MGGSSGQESTVFTDLRKKNYYSTEFGTTKMSFKNNFAPNYGLQGEDILIYGIMET